MQNLILGDYPPIPECFTHVISQRASQQVDDLNEAETFQPEVQLRPRSRLRSRSGSTQTDGELDLDIDQDASVKLMSLSDSDDKEKTIGGTFQKLNSSLGKLQREMKDLRSLDISLLNQLLALNEAIQDFKLNYTDRFSESGSEYSLGTASYMGSMTSLNDDSDWGEDGTLLNSPLLDGNDTLLGENQDSTKELLMQISNLALKAEQDF